ncbi:MAG: glycosyltransferase [Methylobacteriaceae bacterium]|nr:glycosyltransferase [Methylobacteriaceae bacterium]MBV9247118.1 glycosyltransferase [Methylobacteriaceae bacterium]MBV9634937.1 glycosyltransferase [Methylobacteriaceae bacterium]
MTRSIVVVVKGYPRLSETFIAQEILGLERAGFRLHIVSLRRPTDATVHPVHRQIGASVTYLCEYLHEAPLRVLRSFWRVRRRPGLRAALAAFLRDFRRDPSRNRLRRFGQALVLAAELPADAKRLHAHFIHTPASATRYASLVLGLPWSCSAHAKDIWTTPDWDLRDKLADADWVVTCTKAGQERLEGLGAREKPVRLVYHGLDHQRFSPMTAPRSLRDGHDVAYPATLLTVGRAVEKKGLDILLEALSRLPASLHWRWTHIGGGSLRKRLMAQAQDLGLAPCIDWLGAQDQDTVLAHYRTADVFVLPCRVARDGDRDGLPNVLMEAQSQALACLSTQAGAVAELIEDGQSGLLVPPEDPQALADGLIRLIESPELRRRLGRAGAARVRQAFDHRDGIARLAALFEGRTTAGDLPALVAAEP